MTGTRTGIGRDLAEWYLQRGHRVVGCSRGKPDWGHDDYAHYELDVADERAVRLLFADVRKRFGRLDHVVNNAGVANMNHALLTSADSLRRVLETNVVGTFLFCREAAKVMQRKRTGRIVNLSTVAVPLKLEGEAAYVASKSAVESLTHVLAREFAAFGVTVNAIGPVPIDTDLIRGVPREKIDALVARQAIPRLGTTEDVANVIDFFLSPASGFVTGQVLYLGGV